MSIHRDVQNGLQLSTIVEVVARAGAEIAGNDISEEILGNGFAENDLNFLIAARIRKNMVDKGIGV